MMTRKFTKTAVATLLSLTLWNCNTTDPEPSPYESGTYVFNQGNFSQNNGTISFVPRNSATVSDDIFNTANARTLTGGVQDYTEIDGKGLILVDNSTAGQDKVEIVEIGTFKSRTSIGTPGIENPRKVVAVGPNRAYVSCWDVSGSFDNGTFYKDPGYIAVVDLNNGTVSKKIVATRGVQNLVATKTEVYAGTDPGYDKNVGDNNLLVIDINTDAVKQKIDLGAPPQPIALDADGKLWLVVGRELIRMDTQTKSIEKRLTFVSQPGNVTLSKDKLAFYYTLSGKTYRIPTSAATVASASVLANRSFSGLGVDPVAGTVHAIYIPSFVQAGYVLRYQPDNGTLIDSVKVGIAPAGFFFR